MVKAFNGAVPNIDESCFVAENATVIGEVELQRDASVWFGAVLRGDEGAIIIGKGSNVQDNAVMHNTAGYTTVLGENVTVGHAAIVHGAEIGDNSLVGMGAIVMNGAVVGKDCVIGAGAVVKENMEVPDGSVVVGVPGKIVKTCAEHNREANLMNAEAYVLFAKEYLEQGETHAAP